MAYRTLARFDDKKQETIQADAMAFFDSLISYDDV